MNYPIIAIVHIEFLKRKLREEDIQDVEYLLRSEQDIYHLNVRERTIGFYIFGKERIDYGVLDRIKELLKDRGYPNFVITADEYIKTGQKYHYDSSGKTDAA